MEGRAGRIDELRHFLLAENRGQTVNFFRIWSIGDTPRLLESLNVEEPWRTQMGRY